MLRGWQATGLHAPVIGRGAYRLLISTNNPAGVVNRDVVGIITQDRILALARAGPSPDHERGCVKARKASLPCELVAEVPLRNDRPGVTLQMSSD